MFFAEKGGVLVTPKDSRLGNDYTHGDETGAVRWFVDRHKRRGKTVVSFGIGAGDDKFLSAVDVAAVLPGGDGRSAGGAVLPEAVHRCKAAGQDGWNEWAELLLRRVEVVTIAD